MPRLSSLFLPVLVLLALPLLAADQPVALRIDCQALGAGQAGTVMGLVIQVAPEDRQRIGERARVGLTLFESGAMVDRQTSVVSIEDDGSAMLYVEWEVGSYELEVLLEAVGSRAAGTWIGPVEVPEKATQFVAPADAPADAIALEVSAPREGSVQFLPPTDRGGIGGLQLEVEVPEATRSVEFLHDGKSLGRRNRGPWTVSIALGEIVRRTVVRAVARDGKGRFLGEDAIVINSPTGQLGVEILVSDSPDDPQATMVTVAVSAAEDLQEVSLSLDDQTIARWIECPCVAELETAALESAAVLAADAVATSGARGDAVLPLAGGGGFMGSVRVELVELPVTVLEPGGPPIGGLSQPDFRVLEDGQEVTIEGFGTSGELPLSLALAVDISGSMGEVFPTVRRIVAGFTQHLLKEGDEVTLIAFSWDAEPIVAWTREVDVIGPTLARLGPEGGTSLHDAVITSLEQFRGRRGRQALVLLSDGDDTASHTRWRHAKRYAHTMRIPIFTIGLRVGNLDWEARRVLKDLAEETGGASFFPKKVEDLPAVYARIEELLRSQYLLWYSSPSTKPLDEFREIQVELTQAAGEVKTIRGYYPGK